MQILFERLGIVHVLPKAHLTRHFLLNLRVAEVIAVAAKANNLSWLKAAMVAVKSAIALFIVFVSKPW